MYNRQDTTIFLIKNFIAIVDEEQSNVLLKLMKKVKIIFNKLVEYLHKQKDLSNQERLKYILYSRAKKLKKIYQKTVEIPPFIIVQMIDDLLSRAKMVVKYAYKYKLPNPKSLLVNKKVNLSFKKNFSINFTQNTLSFGGYKISFSNPRNVVLTSVFKVNLVYTFCKTWKVQFFSVTKKNKLPLDMRVKAVAIDIGFRNLVSTSSGKIFANHRERYAEYAVKALSKKAEYEELKKKKILIFNISIKYMMNLTIYFSATKNALKI